MTGILNFFMLGSYPAGLLHVGGSTQVPICAWNNVWNNTWGLPPPVKLESRNMTYIMLVWRNTKWKHVAYEALNELEIILYFLKTWRISSEDWLYKTFHIHRKFYTTKNLFLTILHL
jgi:hypothetical protein